MIRKSVKAKNLDLAKAENCLSCDASNLLFDPSLSSQQVHRVQELSQYYFRTDYRAADALSLFSCSPATAFIKQRQIFGSEPLRHLLQALRLCTKCSFAALTSSPSYVSFRTSSEQSEPLKVLTARSSQKSLGRKAGRTLMERCIIRECLYVPENIRIVLISSHHDDSPSKPLASAPLLLYNRSTTAAIAYAFPTKKSLEPKPLELSTCCSPRSVCVH